MDSVGFLGGFFAQRSLCLKQSTLGLHNIMYSVPLLPFSVTFLGFCKEASTSTVSSMPQCRSVALETDGE